MLVGDGATAGATATPVPGLIVLPLFLAPDEEMFIARALLGDRAAEIVPECAEIGENGAKMDENGAKMTQNGGELDENGRARPRYPPKRGGKIKKKGQAAFVSIGVFLLLLACSHIIVCFFVYLSLPYMNRRNPKSRENKK
jgi:hypothetical protein